MILTFGSELIKSFEYILHFVNFVNGTKFCACRRIAESRFRFWQFLHLPRIIKLLSCKTAWACIRERPSQEEEKFNFISFNQLMGLEESDGDIHQDEEDKHDQQNPKMKQKDQLFSTLNQMGMSISKMAQLDTLGLSQSTIKRKRRQLKETRLIKRQPGSGRKRSSTKKRSALF